MPLTIGHEGHKLAVEIAHMTGETVEDAVVNALRQRLIRVKRSQGKTSAEELMELARRCASHLKQPYRSMEIDDLLYGEDGLPK